MYHSPFPLTDTAGRLVALLTDEAVDRAANDRIAVEVFMLTFPKV